MRDLATRLETEGVTDAVAVAEFGFASTFSMAEAWLPRIQRFQALPAAVEPQRSWWREYWKGISFALPMLASILSIMLLDFSLWGGDLSPEDATATGLGIVCSFLLGGGFVQVIARRGLFLAGTNQFHRCEQSTWCWARRGVASTILASLVLVAASAYWDWLPSRISLTTAAFCVALSLFWMATGIFHVLDRGMLVTWVTLGGIALVGALRFALHLPLVISQLGGILVSACAAFLISARLLRRRCEKPVVAEVPSSFLRDVFFLWPYFSYGILYYLLLFADRLVAWTAHTHASAFAVQFRADYETALNLGLVSFIVEVGWVHCSTVSFYRIATQAQKNFSIGNTGGFEREMIRFYWNRLARFIPVALAGAIAGLLAAKAGGFLHGSVLTTAACSLAGFPFLVVGLWNVSLLFALSIAQKAAAATAIACLVDLTAGYLLTRIGDYHYAIVGFLLGALVFAFLSGYWTLRAFRRLDYFYFAASA